MKTFVTNYTKSIRNVIFVSKIDMIIKVNGYALFIVFTNIQNIIIHYGNTLNDKHVYIITHFKKLQLSKTCFS